MDISLSGERAVTESIDTANDVYYPAGDRPIAASTGYLARHALCHFSTLFIHSLQVIPLSNMVQCIISPSVLAVSLLMSVSGHVPNSPVRPLQPQRRVPAHDQQRRRLAAHGYVGGGLGEALLMARRHGRVR